MVETLGTGVAKPRPAQLSFTLLNVFWPIFLFARFDRLARLAKAGWYLEVADGLVKPQQGLLLDPLSLGRNKCPPHPPYT